MISFQPLFELAAEVAAPQVVPGGPYGDRRFIPVTGGSFTGERLSGRVLPGGSDCQLIRPDGVGELDVRVTLETGDGTVILMKGLGMRHGAPEIMQRIAAGEEVPASEYYFRQAMMFDAPDGDYAWLNKLIAIASGERRANQVVISVFEVL